MFRYVVVPILSIGEVDGPRAAAIVAHLRKLSGDMRLTLVRVEKGSVKLVLEGSREGFERIEALFRSGQLAQELGIGIAELGWLGTPAKDETGSTSPHPKSATIKILFLSANPAGTGRLALDQEIREVTSKIRAADYRDSLELVSWWAVRPDDLLQSFNEHRPHIVHFSGHGSHSEEIILTDSSGRPKPVSKAALVSLFRTLKDNIRVVLLNACFSRPQAEAIIQVSDCAIGMRTAIGDQAAITFAASFYRAIAFGRSVQEAFEQGTTALMLEGIPEEDTPELLVRAGVNASEIFLLNSK